jgi:hypothetical protein
VAEARVGLGGAVSVRPGPPIKIRRAVAKRTRIVSPRPAALVIPVSVDDGPETVLEAPTQASAPAPGPAPLADPPWTTALVRVAPQAP